ncbi:exocyst complex component EXO70A1-like [Camellia sinensis]|uniref:exocyst complex component EXO70A1-like n=1 Tax=Camellia sinensis TaxID=4442 RepID=UPI001035612C|nr:exocyst complex component EXO70A1-like [Camellia sinensis]
MMSESNIEEMGVRSLVMETLSEKVTFMRESLQKSQTFTDNMVTILGSFDHRLSALETAMRPTQIRTHSIRRAHENIDKTLKAAEVFLAQFDLSRQVGCLLFCLFSSSIIYIYPVYFIQIKSWMVWHNTILNLYIYIYCLYYCQ